MEQKKLQLKKLKLDFIIIIKFNKKFSSQSAEEFIKKIIFQKTKCKYLYVSKNFKFGFRRQGNIKTLKNLRKNITLKTLLPNLFKKKNKMISSTFIRKKIRLGKITEVNKLLNRNWSVVGKVIKGQKGAQNWFSNM